MIMSGLILSVLGIALLCWLLFTLAIQALPLYIGAVAATLAFQNGVGAVLAIIIGIVAAASAFGITQFAFARTKSASARLAIAVLVMAPAVFAGYHATLGIARIIVTSEPGRQTLALLGSFVIGCLTLIRLHARRDVRLSAACDQTLAVNTPLGPLAQVKPVARRSDSERTGCAETGHFVPEDLVGRLRLYARMNSVGRAERPPGSNKITG